MWIKVIIQTKDFEEKKQEWDEAPKDNPGVRTEARLNTNTVSTFWEDEGGVTITFMNRDTLQLFSPSYEEMIKIVSLDNIDFLLDKIK